jgi:hypothetical protein
MQIVRVLFTHKDTEYTAVFSGAKDEWVLDQVLTGEEYLDVDDEVVEIALNLDPNKDLKGYE